MAGKVGLIGTQLALAMLALLAIAFTPPAQGRMLLVPLDGQPVSGGTLGALRATPLAAGPLPGSLIVDGERSRLSALWAKRVLVLAAPAALCASE